MVVVALQSPHADAEVLKQSLRAIVNLAAGNAANQAQLGELGACAGVCLAVLGGLLACQIGRCLFVFGLQQKHHDCESACQMHAIFILFIIDLSTTIQLSLLHAFIVLVSVFAFMLVLDVPITMIGFAITAISPPFAHLPPYWLQLLWRRFSPRTQSSARM